MPALLELAASQRRRSHAHERFAVLRRTVEGRAHLAGSAPARGSERKVLELPLDLPDAEPVRQRRVDLHRLRRDPLLLLRRQRSQRAHVVEPVGELDEHDAEVLGHREEHLAEVLRLLLLVGMGAELGQLRHAVDEAGDLGPELLLDVGEAVLRVLGHVVQERRLDRDRVDAEVGEDLGRRDRVRHVGLARRPDLRAVGLHGEVNRALDPSEIGGRIVLVDRC